MSTPAASEPRICHACGQPLPVAAELCKCSHSRTSHNTETKAMPCSHLACGCERFRPAGDA